MSRARLKRLAPAFAIAALVLVPLAIWGGSELTGPQEAELAVELLPATVAGPREIVVSITSEELNDTETTAGQESVTLECVDAEGEVLARLEHPFPFTDTDGGTLAPHVHQVVPPEVADVIESCRLEGTDPALEGRLQAPATAG